MTASDDAKFERARREAPTRWTAAIVREPAHNDERPAQGGPQSMEVEEESPVDGEPDS